MKKLKQREIPEYREELLKRQANTCPICTRPIVSDPVLDHCHRSGHIRAVLHRECNAIEGKIANWFKSFGKDVDPELFLEGLKLYWRRDFTNNPYHPKHKTESEKKIRVLKRRLRQAKRDSTKERLKEQIKELQDE